MRESICRLLALLLLGIFIAGCDGPEPPPHLRVPGGDAGRGLAAIDSYGCGNCHTIPGLRRAAGVVGPPLTRFAARSHVGGVVPNRPRNLVRWIMDPPSISPQTAMPVLGVSEQDARDIAAYLYTLGIAEATVEPPMPQLRVTPPMEHREALAAEAEQRLRSYGWVDREAGIVHIPIDRAIELMAEQ